MDIKQLFKKKKDFKKKNLDLNPDFYWKVIVFCTIAVVVASFIFSYYTFTQVRREPTSLNDSVDNRQPIEKQRLEKVLEYFAEREKKSAQILSSPAPVVDPSL